MTAAESAIEELRHLQRTHGADPDAAMARASTVLATAEATGDRRVGGWAHLVLGACAVERTEVVPALVALAQATERLSEAGDEEGLLSALALLVNAWVMTGDRAEARLTAGRGLRLARRLGARATEARLLVNLAYTHGEDDDAVSYETLTVQALAIFEELGDDRATAHCLVNLGGALTRSGQFTEARRSYDRAERLCRGRGWAYVEALLWSGRGGLELAMGDWRAAVALYAESERRLRSLGRQYQCVRQMILVAEQLPRHGETPEAIERLRLAAEEASEAGFPGLVAQARETLARFTATLGDGSESRRHANEAAAARSLLARTHPEAESPSPSLVARVREVVTALDHPRGALANILRQS
jgi:tetratricopeptide (TPR) repeat protein